MKFASMIILFQIKFLFQRKLMMSHGQILNSQYFFLRKFPPRKSCDNQSKLVTYIWLKITHFTSSLYYSGLSETVIVEIKVVWKKVRSSTCLFTSDSKFCKILTLLAQNSFPYFLDLVNQLLYQHCKIFAYGQAVTTLFCFSSSFMSFSATQQ